MSSVVGELVDYDEEKITYGIKDNETALEFFYYDILFYPKYPLIYKLYYKAIESNDIDVLKKLVAEEISSEMTYINRNYYNRKCEYVVHWAANFGTIESMKVLVGEGSARIDVFDIWHETPKDVLWRRYHRDNHDLNSKKTLDEYLKYLSHLSSMRIAEPNIP
jgi:hypothetical protein